MAFELRLYIGNLVPFSTEESKVEKALKVYASFELGHPLEDGSLVALCQNGTGPEVVLFPPFCDQPVSEDMFGNKLWAVEPVIVSRALWDDVSEDIESEGIDLINRYTPVRSFIRDLLDCDKHAVAVLFGH
jgi:hypothetical protein